MAGGDRHERRGEGARLAPLDRVRAFLIRAEPDGSPELVNSCRIHEVRHPLSADESVRRIRTAVEAGTYESDWFYMGDLDEPPSSRSEAFARRGRQAFRRGDLPGLTCRDGLVYRTAVFDSVPDAPRAYRELGVDLGMPGG